MVDVSVLGTDVERRVGSSPTKGNYFIFLIKVFIILNKILNTLINIKVP